MRAAYNTHYLLWALHGGSSAAAPRSVTSTGGLSAQPRSYPSNSAARLLCTHVR